MRYSKEQKDKVVARILSGEETIVDISRDTGINANTLYRWRVGAKRTGLSSTTKYKNADKWSAEDKFMVVLETANLSELEFSEYCRKKGIYPEQVKEWKEACMNANSSSEKNSKTAKELKKEKREKEKLQKELDRKEKALAETAALLVLSKKANAIWGTDNEED